MAVKTSELVSLFQDLAVKHKKIRHNTTPGNKHFYRMELNEFATGANSFNGYNLLLEVMPVKYSGSLRDNCFKVREVSFIVIKTVSSITKDNISLAFDETEEIMEDLLSRLNGYIISGSNKITYDIETVTGTQISDGKNYGMRCSVDIKSSHNFELVPNNWSAW